MAENRVQEIRAEVAVSRSTLATQAAISEEHLACIETGVISAKIDTALRLAELLQVELEDLFPQSRQLVTRGKYRLSRDELVALHYENDSLRAFEAAGVDLDPATWRLGLRLRGGTELEFVLSTADLVRLDRNVDERDPSAPFFVFHSSRVAVAIHLDHLLHFYELWDSYIPPDWHNEQISTDEVTVILSDSATPLAFDVDADEVGPDDEHDIGQLNFILVMLETLVESGSMFHFTDGEGESAYFRTEDVALLVIPLRLLSPQLNEALAEIEMGREETGLEGAPAPPIQD